MEWGRNKCIMEETMKRNRILKGLFTWVLCAAILVGIIPVGSLKPETVVAAEDAGAYADISEYAVLKDLYQPYFKMGVACEALSHWGGVNPLNEIGNPDKEALIKKEFNSITFGNELKPDCNMGYRNANATETNLPFVIDSSAKEMLDWAKKNNILVRGHVLVWHSQCPDAIFCKSYQPVYRDSDNKVLDPSCYVDQDTMRKRLESYIDHTMQYMYANGYGDVIYAWDVVNEAVEPYEQNEYRLRNSYWYQIMGPDFIYYSFKYAREYSKKYAKEYANRYGIDPKDESALKSIEPKLFYNDYNEYEEVKCNAIIDILTKKINGHSIKEEGLIDGIGMQSHLSDSTNIDTYMEALRKYDHAIGEVHITELDVEQTSTGVNADYYQADFYKKFFEALIGEVDNGANITSVTIWGLTDDNSWKKQSLPLLFRANLEKKRAFDGIVSAVTGDDLGEQEFEKPDFSDEIMNFEEDTVLQAIGCRGDGKLTVQSEVVHGGKKALLCSDRTASWNGVTVDVSRFVGQTIAISAWVKSNAQNVNLTADINGVWPNISRADTSDGEWKQMIGTYQIPKDYQNFQIYFETYDTSNIYLDDLKIKLVGLAEGFEGESNIAKARGVGHMPQISVITDGPRSGKKALCIKREEKEASVSLDISKYIGKTVEITAYVKTADAEIKMGLDGEKSELWNTVQAVSGQYVKISTVKQIPVGRRSANVYLETDGNKDMVIDDFSVKPVDYENDLEGSDNPFTTRWAGAGSIERIKENDNHVVRFKDRNETYYGLAFDVSKYLGCEVEISADIKTDDKTISLVGDINNKWPLYYRKSVKPGKYTHIAGIVKLPKEPDALNLYFETEGKAVIYLDNLIITRVPIAEEYNVRFVDGRTKEEIASTYAVKNTVINEPVMYDETFIGWFTDVELTQPFDFATSKITKDTVLYAGFKNSEAEEAVKKVVDAINAIGTVSLDQASKERIDAARAAYEALDEGQKILVPEDVVKILTDAENKYKEEEKKAEANNREPEKGEAGKKESVKAGDILKDVATKAEYVVSLVSEKEMTVTYKKPENARRSSVTIPENIIVDGKVYKVTAIGDGAFKNNKKLKKITISKNVVTIGKEAFKGCSNLKNIRIKSLELTKSSVGKNAFKGIHKKVTIKVPGKKLKAYKALLKKKGMPKTAKVKK